MKRKYLILILLPVILSMLACGAITRTVVPTPSSTPTSIVSTVTDTPAPTFTSTSIPSATATGTQIPPSFTPTEASTATPVPTRLPLNTQLSIFDDLWSIVNDTYVYPDFNGLDWNAIRQETRLKIIQGMTTDQFYMAMSELIYRLGDDHSFFLNPQGVAEQEADFAGKYDYVGIGVLVSAVPERNHAVILSVFTGSPAEAAGLQPRDSIISVDDQPILDEQGYLRDIVRGPEGTTITLSIQTPGESPRDVRITRHRINGDYPLVYTVISTDDGKRIGYILLVTFDDSTVDEKVGYALQDMTADAPLDGLILDNRMNGGGSSTVIEPILSYFASGNLGTYISHDEQRPLRVKQHDINGSSQVPLVVMVGTGTASYGEIFAGILKDIGRAYIIGTTTGGNVEVLWGYDLEDGSQLWLANETFRPVNHPDQDWEKTGIIPDQTVTGDFDQYTLANDPAVQAAIQYLLGK